MSSGLVSKSLMAVNLSSAFFFNGGKGGSAIPSNTRNAPRFAALESLLSSIINNWMAVQISKVIICNTKIKFNYNSLINIKFCFNVLGLRIVTHHWKKRMTQLRKSANCLWYQVIEMNKNNWSIYYLFSLKVWKFNINDHMTCVAWIYNFIYKIQWLSFVGVDQICFSFIVHKSGR